MVRLREMTLGVSLKRSQVIDGGGWNAETGPQGLPLVIVTDWMSMPPCKFTCSIQILKPQYQEVIMS